MVVARTHLLAALLAFAALVDCDLAFAASASVTPSVATTASASSASLFSALGALNATVGGRLKKATPFEAPCFSTVEGKQVQVDAAACAAIQGNYTDPTFRVTHFGAYMLVSIRLSCGIVFVLVREGGLEECYVEGLFIHRTRPGTR